MSTDPTRASIERFVRGTLGCACPDDVFESIAIRPLRAPQSEATGMRLVVGMRLLVYVLESPTDSGLDAVVSELATQGLSERNERGLNRFRLVVASDGSARALDAARASFAREAGNDDRAHLHVISPRLLPASLRGR